MSLIKQQLLAQKIAENNGLPATQQRSARQLIRDAGYSDSSANNPSRVLQSMSWKELMDTLLPDEDILRTLRNNIFSNSGFVSNQAIMIALKIKGRVKPPQPELEPMMDLEELEKENRTLRALITRKQAHAEYDFKTLKG